MNCVTPDAGGDVILAKVTFQCEVSGIADVTLNPITDVNTTVGCLSGTVYDAQMGTDTISITQGLECGNGILEQVAEVYWEECDDGNTLNGDCCSSTCRIDPMVLPALMEPTATAPTPALVEAAPPMPVTPART